MAGKKKFTPMLISFDKPGFERAEKEANEKLEILDEASVWVNKQFDRIGEDINMRKLHSDMVGHFKDIVLKVYEPVNQLGLSARKLIEAKEIPVLELLNIQSKYEKLSVGSGIKFDKNTPMIIVNKKDFQIWSTSEKQNQKIVFGNQMIKAIKDLTDSLSVKVFPMDIQRATSGFITFDIRENEYKVSSEYVLR